MPHIDHRADRVNQELYIDGQTTSHAANHQGDLISVGIPSPYPASRIFMTLILSLSLATTADNRAYIYPDACWDGFHGSEDGVVTSACQQYVIPCPQVHIYLGKQDRRSTYIHLKKTKHIFT